MATQMSSTARKIHNLLSSGAVTVTGPTQQRAAKPKVGSNAVTSGMNSVHPQNAATTTRCYVCDEALSQHQVQHQLLEMQTVHTTTKFPNKIGQLVGDAFLVIVSGEDVICARCTNLINYLDRLENDVERVRTNIIGLLNKKYGMYDEGGGGGGGGVVGAAGNAASAVPPVKMQKLNSGIGNRTADEVQNDTNRIRKINSTTALNDTAATITKQTPPVSAVQQMKITTQPAGAGGAVQQSSAGTQTLIRKITKIYKCLSCDYKTSDMRLFNTHYETCKQQNFQCKNCKKIYPNFGQMKQHMIREHNTPMENTCAVCHINLVNDSSLRKHMEANHATSVVVTSTTTIPASSLAAANAETTVDQLNAANAAITAAPMNTSLYACNQCQFKSTDKVVFDEHLRKHLGKPKPFKCRLCSQRYETREAATAHLKYHPQSQANYFKCGTCSATFPKRELLAKHIETQHPQQDVSTTNTTTNAMQQQQQQQQQINVQTPTGKQQQQHHQLQQQQHHQQPQQQQNMLTTQKLLQDTINEALSENIGTSGVTASAGQQSVSPATDVADVGSAANNIRFYSCQICSLTFLNENYYNQHMETHRRESKKESTNNSVGNVGNTPLTNATAGGTMRSKNSKLNSAATALLSDGDMATAVSTKDNDISAALAQTTTAAIATNNVGNNNNNNNNSIPDVDIESIFEKMHSDNKGDNNNGGADLSGVGGVASNAAIATNNSTSVGSGVGGGGLTTGENVVISSQEGTVGGITFNISIPQASSDQTDKTSSTNSARPSVGIDMPMLDPDDDVNKHKTIDSSNSGDGVTPNTAAGPVSMPSLDDDNDAAVLQEQQQQQQQEEQEQQQQHHQSSGGDTADEASAADLLNDIKMENNNAEHMKAENKQQSDAVNEATLNEQQQQQQQQHEQEQQEQQEQQQLQQHNNIDEAHAGVGDGEEQHAADAAHNDANENATPEQLAAAANSGGATAVQTADGQVAIELDEAMQAQVDSGQIKFILNENGQLLQLDNHIITDADGNQILVQDPEQIQQLLQSVGVLQSGDGIDSETLQVMTDASGQMVLVQGENNETQLIDASLLNADGQLVIQQGQDGELGEGAHVIGEDGTRIPVSVSYTADGQPIVQVQHQVLEAGGEGVDGQQLVLEGKDGVGVAAEHDGVAGSMATDEDGVPQPSDASSVATTSVTTTSATATTTGGGFFSLADIMQQQQQQQQQEQQQQDQQQSSETKAAE